MKIKSIVILALLFAMSTSLLGEHLFTAYNNDSCSSTEHTIELEDSESHDEIHCEIHCDFHHVYAVTQANIFTSLLVKNSLYINKQDSYLSTTNLKFYKPPIA